MSCPGPVDGMGCKTMDQCVPYGEQCPHNCPHVPFIDCASQGMQNCPGPMDPMGCMTADTCVPLGEECPFYCPSMLPMGRLHGLQSRRHLCSLWRRMPPSLSLQPPC